MTPNAVEVRALSLGFGANRVLDGVSFAIPRAGVTMVMGPAGGGKSALLRTLARHNHKLPSFWYEGEVTLGDGRGLFSEVGAAEVQRLVPLLAQKGALYTASVLDNVIDAVRDPMQSMGRPEKVALAQRILEPFGLWAHYESRLDEPVLNLSIGEQRLLCLARLIAADPVCLLADEPFRDLPPEWSGRIRDVLVRWSAARSVVIVEHNLRVARELGQRIVLLAGARVVADQRVEEFFERPDNELVRTFLRSGSCWPQESAPAGAPEPTVATPPRGFHWIIDDALAGTQRPGLLDDEEHDLRALRALGCRHLVSLTLRPVLPEVAGRHGMEAHHFPIEDMGVPSLVGAEHLCRKVEGWLAAKEPTVFHCRAGLGRTGTMLACYLVSRGTSAVSAIGEVRSVNPYYIQSIAQLQFIEEFQLHLRTCRAS